MGFVVDSVSGNVVAMKATIMRRKGVLDCAMVEQTSIICIFDVCGEWWSYIGNL